MSDSTFSPQADSTNVKKIRKFVRNSGYTALSDLFDRIANIFVIVYLSNSLGAAAVGTYTLAISYFFIGSRFAFWGLDHLLIRNVALRPDTANKYVVNFVILRALLSLGAIALLSLLLFFLPYTTDVRVIIIVFLFSILGENVINIAEAVFISAERMEFLSILALFGGLLKLISCIVVIALGGKILHVAMAFLLTSLLSLVVSLFLLRRLLGGGVLEFDLEFCREQLTIAKPFVVVAITFILNSRLDTILLSLFVSKADIGFYGAAVTVVTALTMVPQSIATAIFPVLARSRAQYDLGDKQKNGDSLASTIHSTETTNQYRQIFKYMVIIVIPLSLGLIAIADRAIDFVFSADFLNTIPILRILALFIVFNGLNVLNSRLLIVANRQDLIARYQAITLCLNVLLIFLLVPLFGLIGAAIAKLITIAGLYAFMHRAVYNSISAFSIVDLLKKPVLAGIGMVLVTFLLHTVPLWFQIGMGAITYVVLIVMMGTITPTEQVLWRNVLKN